MYEIKTVSINYYRKGWCHSGGVVVLLSGKMKKNLKKVEKSKNFAAGKGNWSPD